MSNILNAFTTDTAKNLQLDAGIVVTGLDDPGTFDGVLQTPAKSLGATSGGGKFTAIPTFRNLFDGIDGAKGEYKGGVAIDFWDIKLSVQLKEVTKDNLMLALGAADVTTSANHDIITGRCNIKDTDYLANICWLGTVNGFEKPLIIELKNVMSKNGLNFTATDKGTGAIDLEFTAHFDVTTPNEVPFKIYSPKTTTPA